MYELELVVTGTIYEACKYLIIVVGPKEYFSLPLAFVVYTSDSGNFSTGSLKVETPASTKHHMYLIDPAQSCTSSDGGGSPPRLKCAFGQQACCGLHFGCSQCQLAG